MRLDKLEKIISELKAMRQRYEELRALYEEDRSILLEYMYARIALQKLYRSLLYTLAYEYVSLENEEIREEMEKLALELIKDNPVGLTESDWHNALKIENIFHKYLTKRHLERFLREHE